MGRRHPRNYAPPEDRRSTGGRYASYWNAFLSSRSFQSPCLDPILSNLHGTGNNITCRNSAHTRNTGIFTEFKEFYIIYNWFWLIGLVQKIPNTMNPKLNCVIIFSDLKREVVAVTLKKGSLYP